MQTISNDFKRLLNTAKRELKANGWEHILSAMSDSNTGTRYGLLYTRNGAEFWLNKDTMGNLPA